MKRDHNRGAKVGGRYAGYANGGKVTKHGKEVRCASADHSGELDSALKSMRAPLPRERRGPQ
jgi:hypothetical protein